MQFVAQTKAPAQRRSGKFKPIVGMAPQGIPMFGGPPGAARTPMTKIIFNKYDTDNSGTLDYEEFQGMCYDMGHFFSEEEMKLALASIDDDQSGQIEYEEFLTFWKSDERFGGLRLSEEETVVLKQATETFRFCDADNSGSLEAGAEFTACYKQLTAQGFPLKPVAAAMAELDSNGDGSISFNEFILWMVKAHALQQAPDRDSAQAVFDQYTDGGSTSIDARRFQAMCYDQGHFLSPDELAVALAAVDSDGSGGVEFGEFKQWWDSTDKWGDTSLSPAARRSVRMASALFQRYDSATTGALNPDQFAALFADLSARGVTAVASPQAALEGMAVAEGGQVTFNALIRWLAVSGALESAAAPAAATTAGAAAGGGAGVGGLAAAAAAAAAKRTGGEAKAN